MKLKYLIIALCILFSFNFVSAKFVCGEVLPSDENTSPSWYSVYTYNYVDSSKKTNCLVSPEEYRFCCDLDSVRGYSWKNGDVWIGGIKNFETGHVAGEVNVTLSVNSYDVFPQMKIEKVIRIKEPSRKVYLNEKQINFSFDFLEGYDLVLINGEKIELENNSYFNENNISGGVNNLGVSASNGEETFFEVLNFGEISSFILEREFSCNGCKKNKVRAGEKVEVGVFLNLSDGLEGFKYREYIPFGWEVISDSEVKASGLDYNYIEWEIEGDYLEASYSLQSPTVGSDYIFAGYVEDLLLGEEEIKLQKLINTPPKKSSPRKYSYDPKEYSVIVPGKALVFNGAEVGAGVYSNENKSDAFFEINEIISKENFFNAKYELYKGYGIESNLDLASFEKMILDLEIKEKDFNVVGVDAYGKKIRLTGNFVSEGDYRIETNHLLKKIIVYKLDSNPNLIISLVDKFIGKFGRMSAKFGFF